MTATSATSLTTNAPHVVGTAAAVDAGSVSSVNSSAVVTAAAPAVAAAGAAASCTCPSTDGGVKIVNATQLFRSGRKPAASPAPAGSESTPAELTPAMDDLSTRVDNLKARIKTLKNEKADLQKRNEALAKQLEDARSSRWAFAGRVGEVNAALETLSKDVTTHLESCERVLRNRDLPADKDWSAVLAELEAKAAELQAKRKELGESDAALRPDIKEALANFATLTANSNDALLKLQRTGTVVSWLSEADLKTCGALATLNYKLTALMVKIDALNTSTGADQLAALESELRELVAAKDELKPAFNALLEKLIQVADKDLSAQVTEFMAQVSAYRAEDGTKVQELVRANLQLENSTVKAWRDWNATTWNSLLDDLFRAEKKLSQGNAVVLLAPAKEGLATLAKSISDKAVPATTTYDASTHPQTLADLEVQFVNFLAGVQAWVQACEDRYREIQALLKALPAQSTKQGDLLSYASTAGVSKTLHEANWTKAHVEDHKALLEKEATDLRAHKKALLAQKLALGNQMDGLANAHIPPQTFFGGLVSAVAGSGTTRSTKHSTWANAPAQVPGIADVKVHELPELATLKLFTDKLAPKTRIEPATPAVAAAASSAVVAPGGTSSPVATPSSSASDVSTTTTAAPVVVDAQADATPAATVDASNATPPAAAAPATTDASAAPAVAVVVADTATAVAANATV